MKKPFIVVAFAMLSGCAYNWQESQRVDLATVHKIETELAAEFCTKLLGSPKRGCAIRLNNTGTNETTCVMIVMPNDGYAIAHEGGHCMGYDHK
jgi:hypothetical protein